MSKLISIISPCYNEEKNVELLAQRISELFAGMPQYDYELIFADNCSTDGTIEALRRLARQDKHVKAIINMRNFGAIRSGYHVLLQAYGDAVVSMAADLQDPPELIPEFIKRWEQGDKLVVAVKTQSQENPLMYAIRSIYYRLLNKMANVQLIEHFTGFGLYDQSVIVELRKLNDRHPYLRGLVSELGFPVTKIPFVQPVRKYGKTKMNFYHLYDLAIQGMTSHSIVPMRLATMMGFFLSAVCFLVALFYLVYKLFHWYDFQAGMAPIIIGMFGMFALQLMFIGLIGEYIGASHRYLLNRPLVVERERINFDNSVENGTADKHADEIKMPQQSISDMSDTRR